MLAKGIADINLLTFYNHMHHNDPILEVRPISAEK
jgi:hypothetical protein